MIDTSTLTDLAKKLSDAVPTGIKEAKSDVESLFKNIIQQKLAKMDLVSYEEFAAQKKVLQRTREKLTVLEKQVAELEKKQP